MAKELKFTRDDRTFLREIFIDPEPEAREAVLDAMLDGLVGPSTSPGPAPQTIIISAAIARAILREYGELNWDTWIAFKTGRGVQERHSGKPDRPDTEPDPNGNR